MPGILLCIICDLNLSSRKAMTRKSLKYIKIKHHNYNYNKRAYFSI
ncbi:hypothetical protein IU300_004274 [Escherichia coli]|nr:hypothetical protein [Escherichia coli]